MSPPAIKEVRRSVVASGEARHKAFPGVVKLSSGDILVFYMDGSDHWRTSDAVVKMVRSKDEGQSWSAPELVFSEPGWGVGAHHGPEQLSDGRLLLPMTLITNVPRDVGTRGYRDADVSRASKVYMLTSEDGGETWSEPAQVGPLEGWSWENQYGRVRELPDGRVFVPGGGQKSGDDTWYSGYFVSHDGGRTFPDRVEVARGLRDEIDLARLPPTGDGSQWCATCPRIICTNRIQRTKAALGASPSGLESRATVPASWCFPPAQSCWVTGRSIEPGPTGARSPRRRTAAPAGSI